jgi:hypothetical protein
MAGTALTVSGYQVLWWAWGRGGPRPRSSALVVELDLPLPELFEVWDGSKERAVEFEALGRKIKHGLERGHLLGVLGAVPYAYVGELAGNAVDASEIALQALQVQDAVERFLAVDHELFSCSQLIAGERQDRNTGDCRGCLLLGELRHVEGPFQLDTSSKFGGNDCDGGADDGDESWSAERQG